MELFYTVRGWMIRFTEADPDRQQILSLFKTDVIPTAYTPQAKPEEVLEAIRNRNPGRQIYIR